MLLQPMKQACDESDDEVIVTSVGFTDRQASLQAAEEFDTEKAIADLYAHVAQMPDSAHKRHLMKKVSTLMLHAQPVIISVVHSFTTGLLRKGHFSLPGC